MEKITVRKISNIEFMLLYAGNMPGIINHYAARCGPADFIYLLQKGQSVAGVAVFVRAGTADEVELSYVYIEECYRGKGLAKQFLGNIFSRIAAEGISKCRARTIVKEDSAESMFCELGFRKIDEGMVVRCLINEENRIKWNQYLQKRAYAIKKWCAVNDISVIRFDHADNRILDGIFNVQRSQFPKELSAEAVVRGQGGRFLTEYSFISCKGSRPVAYTMVSEADARSLVFSHVSTVKGMEGSGAFAGAFLETMECIFEGEYEVIGYAVLSGNYAMKKLVRNMIADMALSNKKQIYWIKKITDREV